MKTNRLLVTVAFSFFTLLETAAQKLTDYISYHQQIIYAEEFIIENKYSEALSIVENNFISYDYVFLKDYKVATQLALYIGDKEKAYKFLRLGISNGWLLKEIYRDKFLKSIREDREWDVIKSQYSSLHAAHEKSLNQPLREEIQEMSGKDQKLAFGNLLRLGKKTRERFLLKKFAPHSERQLVRLEKIMCEYGYPGEKLIGNRTWMSRILSHHNSISNSYAQKDTLYMHLQPQLRSALRRGEISPGDYAIIEDWHVSTKPDRQEGAYGYLNPLTSQELSKSNVLRQSIGLHSVETRNRLVDIQDQTGMNFYLDGAFWVKGKIAVIDRR